MLQWLKERLGSVKPVGTWPLGTDPFAWRKGKSIFDDAVASSGAKPGDIVEIDEQGRARVVGRLPRLAADGTHCGASAQSIHNRLRKIYGDDAACASDITDGCNIIVVRKPVNVA